MLGVVGKEGVGEAEHRLDARVGDPVVDRSPLPASVAAAEGATPVRVVGRTRCSRGESLAALSGDGGVRGGDWLVAGGVDRSRAARHGPGLDGGGRWCGRRSLRLPPASTTQTRAKQAKTRSPPADSNRRPLLAIAPSPAPVMCPVGADREAAARQRSSASRCATVSACGRRASAASRMSERTEAARALRSTSGSTAPTWASLHRASVSAERSS